MARTPQQASREEFEREAIKHLDALTALKTDSERYTLNDWVFYLHAPDGIGRSKLAASVGRHLGVACTGRNWNTVAKLAEMAAEMESR